MVCNISPVLLFSGKILLASSISNLILGSFTGVFLSRNKTIGARFLDIIISLPLVFPPIAMGFFFLLVLGRNSPVGKFLESTINLRIIFSSAGVFLAAFLAGFPLMVKSVMSSASQLDPSIIEMADIQGASSFQIFIYIILPNLRAGILYGLTLSTARGLGEVGMTLMLGGNIAGKTETLSLAIYNAVFEGNFTRAALLSFFVAFVSVLFFITVQKIENKELSI